jgi:hypothetical protein
LPLACCSACLSPPDCSSGRCVDGPARPGAIFFIRISSPCSCSIAAHLSGWTNRSQ